jgi:hypothetical protein
MFKKDYITSLHIFVNVTTPHPTMYTTKKTYAINLRINKLAPLMTISKS